MKLFFTVTKKSLIIILSLAVTVFLCIMWCSSIKVSAIDGSTHQNRMVYISALKLEVDGDNPCVKETVIPEEFGNVYTQYNKIQKQAGFDLSRFKGESVTVYTYPIKNQEKNLTLIVHKGKIIGGDIADISVNGEMLPLKES